MVLIEPVEVGGGPTLAKHDAGIGQYLKDGVYSGLSERRSSEFGNATATERFVGARQHTEDRAVSARNDRLHGVGQVHWFLLSAIVLD